MASFPRRASQTLFAKISGYARAHTHVHIYIHVYAQKDKAIDAQFISFKTGV